MNRVSIAKQIQVLTAGVFGGAVLIATNIVTGGTLEALLGSTTQTDMLFFGLFAGVSEELFFRGFFQTFIRIYLPWLIFTIPISALVFALFHIFIFGVSITMLGVLFALGVVLGLLFEIYNDIGVPMIAHIINNLGAMSAVVLTVLTDNFVFVAVAIVAGVMGYILLSTRRRGRRRR